MVRYDSEVLYTFAERLEASAKSVIYLYAFLGVFIGAVCGYGLVERSVSTEPSDYIPLVVGSLVGLLVGYLVGSEHAFRIRLGVHTVLCQVQIEENTRPSGSRLSHPDQAPIAEQSPKRDRAAILLSMPEEVGSSSVGR
jgi:hypothetical protein